MVTRPKEMQAPTRPPRKKCSRRVVLDRLGFQAELEPECHLQDCFRIFAFTVVRG